MTPTEIAAIVLELIEHEECVAGRPVTSSELKCLDFAAKLEALIEAKGQTAAAAASDDTSSNDTGQQ